MFFTDAEMDAAIDRWRKFPTLEELNAALAESQFKAALDAAADRAWKSGDPKTHFWIVDAGGWRPPQFCVDVPPPTPMMQNGPEPDWTEREKRRTPIPGAAFPS